MNKGIYCRMQLKRSFRFYPAVFAVTLLLAIGVSFVATMLLKVNEQKTEAAKRKVNIGLVGNIEDTYLGVGIETVRNIDSSALSIEFVPVTEAEAVRGLRNGDLMAYVRIPDDFVESIECGENYPMTFVTEDGPVSFGTVLTQELIGTVSGMVTESQSAIYGMQDLLEERKPSVNIWKKGAQLSAEYIAFMLKRSESYKWDLTGAKGGISTGGYYIAGITVFFLLLWGVACSAFMTRKNNTLSRVLAARGCGSVTQTLSEYAAYVTPGMITLFVIFASLGLSIGGKALTVPELSGMTFTRYLWLTVRLIPAFLLIAAFQYLLFEWIEGTVPALLAQFLSAVALGYVSGCFYPDSFFPLSIQRVAEKLPSGVAFSYVRDLLNGTYHADLWLWMIGYTALFLGTSVALRKYKIGRKRV